jgi:hypothetical protein
MPDKFSIDQFPDHRFSAHGHYEIWKEGETFMISVEGPFNLESVVAMGKARQAALTAWGSGDSEAWIVIFQTSMMMSLEALNAYSAGLQKHLQACGPAVALAWVAAPDVEGRSIMLDHFSRIFSRFQVPWKVFEERACAKVWVQDRLNARTGCGPHQS